MVREGEEAAEDNWNLISASCRAGKAGEEAAALAAGVHLLVLLGQRRLSRRKMREIHLNQTFQRRHSGGGGGRQKTK